VSKEASSWYWPGAKGDKKMEPNRALQPDLDFLTLERERDGTAQKKMSTGEGH